MLSLKNKAFWIAFPLAVTAVSIWGVEPASQAGGDGSPARRRYRECNGPGWT